MCVRSGGNTRGDPVEFKFNFNPESGACLCVLQRVMWAWEELYMERRSEGEM